MTEFGGWLMPLQYKGVIAEHKAVRQGVGLFDVSHLGKLIVGGDGAAESLDSWLPGMVAGLGEWRAAYNLVLNESGGILDDIFVYRTPGFFILIPNAANTEIVMKEAEQALPGIEVRDARETWAILALSGPKARDVVGRVAPDVAEMKLHQFRACRVAGAESMVARTGYTGEVTFEFVVPWEQAEKVWGALVSGGEPDGIVPTGLGARDTLRLEMGYPLHGHEISAETNPIEAGLDWVIKWQKPAFKARSILEEIRRKGTTRKLVGLVGQGREVPREGYPILHDGRSVGRLTSGNFSPSLGTGIALGYVPSELSQEGTMLAVDVRGRSLPMKVTKPPFVTSS